MDLQRNIFNEKSTRGCTRQRVVVQKETNNGSLLGLLAAGNGTRGFPSGESVYYCRERIVAGLNEEVTGNQTPLQHNRDPQRHIENLIIFKFFLAYSLVVMNAYYFLNQHPGTDATYLPITCISFGLNTFVLTLSGLFYCVLSQLYRQFSQINIQLCLVLEQLRRQSSEAAEVQTALASRINSLGMLHLAGYRLTQEIFAIGELTLAALLLRLLAANMRTVYGACYFLSKRETENLWSQAEEILFTTLFFSDTAMVMSMLNAVLSECNGAGSCCGSILSLWM
ncbi:unnamed protein product [Ceratitis capitata]|uniref:(Mediterranean fruit fly) hypothetical protein n=1 Tax=Ceratitis capitata TaxID=7213 RepID=A0A811V6Q0_CERCA|nr:unnamed protein product [Ceratitis capitata]